MLLQRVTTRLTVDLHPSRLSNIETGVKEHLNSLLLRYNEDLGGIILSYSNEHIISTTASIHPYFPLTRLLISASLLVFKPVPGAHIVGTVSKISDSLIGVVVLDFMNAVIRIEHANFSMLNAENAWVHNKDTSHMLRVGDSVCFQVVDVLRDGVHATVTGSLQDKKKTGNCAVVGTHWSFPSISDGTNGDVGSKKTKKKDREKKNKKKKQVRDDDSTDHDDAQENKKKGAKKVKEGKSKKVVADEDEKSNEKKRRRKDADSGGLKEQKSGNDGKVKRKKNS